ncbi:MAG: transporter substrate-binding domain-containing protein [Parvibaculum sp.]|uniref:transporter substrate-binding domain-containing protein n=1 Tax=Parvibaculum sp. TaxID=2024848 RepID=UPI002ABC9EA2|nr:transporter substrate-binding domain-containing protein [Parvibaculum sp.]MDZ4380742.1 transporter substrate-binding domain-containing protein [Parvibaculum sp.]
MRFLLYANLIAIVLLAGSLARLYEGEPLPWREAAAVPVPAAPLPEEEAAIPVEPSSPLAVEQIVALHLPLPNPVRLPPEPAPVAEPEAKPSREIVILTEGAYPPFNYRDESGALAGFDVELAQALCSRVRTKCGIVAKPWDDLVPSLRQGEGDAVIASMLIPAPGRDSPASGGGLILSERYYSTPGRFAARRNAVPPAATPAALAGRRIAVQAGSIHQAYALMRFPNAAVDAFPSLGEAQQALAEGKADLLFADRNALLRWSASPEGGCCRPVGPDYGDAAWFGEGAAIVLRAGDEELRDRFNEALQELVADGTYARISARYFSASIY